MHLLCDVSQPEIQDHVKELCTICLRNYTFVDLCSLYRFGSLKIGLRILFPPNAFEIKVVDDGKSFFRLIRKSLQSFLLQTSTYCLLHSRYFLKVPPLVKLCVPTAEQLMP